MRNGQWILFNVESPAELERLGAWKAGSKFVGIWQRGGRDAMGNVQAGGIHVVAESGDTIVVFDKAGVRSLVLAIESARDVEPLTDKNQVPPGRKVAEDWEPRP